MWHDFLAAFGLLLVVEGILPFLNPPGLRRALLAAAELDDATLRFIGITSMLAGLVILYLVN